MRILALLLIALPALAADFAGQQAVKLDLGATSYTIANTGPTGGSETFPVPNGFTRVGIVLTPGVFAFNFATS